MLLPQNCFYYVNNDEMLNFSTKFEIEKLVITKFWIIVETFKTVPIMFLQMYTTHALVGINSKILPLVYILSRNQKCYIGNNYDYELNPACIISDFKKKGIHNIFYIIFKLMLFHLAQNVWRKIRYR
ncbi:Uncharacterized protein FWK35_00015627 [Aphis craccivora]|uniref:Uncharacterized protein n=1 Tax=Aphis craccivora TaxID=307492 RepID=A0A6G0Y5H9_APHCR|nr:Uncharacterized protein FWK35_00015627 [Aphis craccivora]